MGHILCVIDTNVSLRVFLLYSERKVGSKKEYLIITSNGILSTYLRYNVTVIEHIKYAM